MSERERESESEGLDIKWMLYKKAVSMYFLVKEFIENFHSDKTNFWHLTFNLKTIKNNIINLLILKVFISLLIRQL